MRKLIKIVVFAFITISGFCLVSCEDEKNYTGKENDTLIDECFLVRGNEGELLDLHITRDKNNQVFITTSLSDINAHTKSTNDDVHDFIIIAESVEFIDNTFVLPGTDKQYWIFEATLGAPVTTKAAPGGGTGTGSSVAITAECNCLANEGECTVTTNSISPNVFTAHCNNSANTPCELSGIAQCKWTLPTIIVYPTIQAPTNTPKITTIVIESDIIDYNGVLYE